MVSGEDEHIASDLLKKNLITRDRRNNTVKISGSHKVINEMPSTNFWTLKSFGTTIYTCPEARVDART
jgi:hypothetical protein